MGATILVVDDEERLRSSIAEIAKSWGYDCLAAADGAEALAALAACRERGTGLCAALVDVRMPRLGGLDFLRKARAISPDLPVLMMTGYPSIESAVVAMKFGAADFFTKPLDLPRLKDELARIAAARTTARRPAASSVRLDGDSEAIRELRSSIERVAPTDAPVVILGESGTGKELVAETLHALSRRGRAPILKLNCAAIPEGLLESELFGHERGAFTGADSRKPGLFERAHGGTVFLDEIGDMELRLQSKVLRVLQDGEFRRVGGSESITTDVRLIAATHRDLPSLIAAGTFREDLYYRLAVIQLRTPPLRERAGDIATLARCFVTDFARRYGKELPALSGELLALLTRQRWPGNVRELKNCLERAVIFCDGPTLGPEHLPQQYRGGAGEHPEARPAEAGAAFGGAREALERTLVIDALERAGGNRTRAAELLGIHRRTLYNMLKRFGIDDDAPSRAH
jgi:DNA-binding NtrC family response regulator